MKVYISAYTAGHTTHVQFTVNAKSHEHAITKTEQLFRHALTHLDIHHIHAYTTPERTMSTCIHAHTIRVHGSVCNGKVLIQHGNAHTAYSTPYTTHIHNNKMRTHHTIQEHTPAHTAHTAEIIPYH